MLIKQKDNYTISGCFCIKSGILSQINPWRSSESVTYPLNPGCRWLEVGGVARGGGVWLHRCDTHNHSAPLLSPRNKQSDGENSDLPWISRPAFGPAPHRASFRPGRNTWWGWSPAQWSQSPGSTCSPCWTPTWNNGKAGKLNLFNKRVRLLIRLQINTIFKSYKSRLIPVTAAESR